MTRREAVARPPLWAGEARTKPRTSGGWHHHGEHESVIYVVKGRLVMETAEDRFTAVAGDFIEVPTGVVHRESNPDDEESVIVVARAGDGATSVNCDAPGGR